MLYEVITTAMVMDLANYYSQNKPEYSIVFMLFYGEEAGLLGSLYYVLNPRNNFV